MADDEVTTAEKKQRVLDWVDHWLDQPTDVIVYKDSRGETPEIVIGDQPTDLIHYVMDLEALVRWFALPFRYFDQQTQEWVQNSPIFTVYDERGTYLAEADRLQRTWNRVMNDA